jgi:hypothetical protein
MNFQTHIKKNPILYIALAVVIVYAYTKFFRKEGQRAGIKSIGLGFMLHSTDVLEGGAFNDLARAIYKAANNPDKIIIYKGFSQVRDKMRKDPDYKITFKGALDQILIKLGKDPKAQAQKIIEEKRENNPDLDKRLAGSALNLSTPEKTPIPRETAEVSGEAQIESNGESEYQPPDQLSLRLSMGNGFLNCEPGREPNTAICSWGDNRRG